MTAVFQIKPWLRALCACLALMLCSWALPASAATCSQAGSQGTAPAAWQTYCWLDFSTYNDVTARSVAGQTISYTLSDGATLSFNVKASSTTANAVNPRTAPSWTGAAVGNSAFLGIPGQPVLYMADDGATVTLTFSSISILPPSGSSAVTAYAFVAADAESTDGAESIQFVTNGSNWTLLDDVAPISGSTMPTQSFAGQTFTTTGGGATGNVGGYIVGSNSPSTITTTMAGSGLQGVMFAVRFASIRLTKVISGARVNANDQFKFDITATTSGAILATGTTSGASNGPFQAAAISLASGIPLTVKESMAAGSVSTLAKYRSTLTCTNSTPMSSTSVPTAVVTTSYSFGPLQFGDAIQCVFTNQSFPHLTLTKVMGAGGRRFNTDQFTLNVASGVTVVATTTTTGTGTTVTTGVTPQFQATAGSPYSVTEIGAGATNLGLYTPALACVNAASSSTILPTTLGGTVTPVMGDIITCTITNTRKPSSALLTVIKYSTVISDPQNGTTNPKMIPGAVLRYFITVTNTGNTVVDANSIVITDPLPAQTLYNAASPVQFTNGTTASGLSAFNAATMVTYSNQASGGTPYTYAPNTAGYDANVKGLRIAPGGTMAAATATTQPSFTVSFLVQIK